MNKRFSTLLAAALVAGSTFSAFAATDKVKEESQTKYFQLKTGTKGSISGDFLAIGYGETRDSLVVRKSTDIKSLADVNETLWRTEFTPVKGSNGAVAEYHLRFFHKASGRQLILNTDIVEAGKTFYQSPAAVLAEEGLDYLTLSTAEYSTLTTLFGGELGYVAEVYSQSTDKTTKYRVALKSGKIRLQSIVSKKQNGGEAEFPEWADGAGDANNIALRLVASKYNETGKGLYPFGAEELNEQGNDGFTLSFSKDVIRNKYKNPFSEYTLHATAEPIYTAATYDVSYATNLAAVKKNYELLDNFQAAIKGYTDGVAEAIEYLKTNKAEKAGKAGDLIPSDMQDYLNMAGEEVDEATTKLGVNSAVLTKAITAAKNNLGKLSNVAIAKDGTLAKDNAYLVAYEKSATAAITAVNALVKDTKDAVDALDKKVQAWMTPENVDAKENWTEEKAALNKIVTANFGTTDGMGKVLNTWTTGIVVTIRTAAAVKSGYYALAIADSLIKGKQAYLTVDTNYVANREKYLTFTADTLVSFTANKKAALVAPLNKNINKYAFKLSAIVDNIATGDSILIDTYAPKVNDNGNFTDVKDGFVTYDDDARVVIRTLGNGREISVTTDFGTNPDEAVYNTNIAFAMPPYAEFEEGEVFYVKNLNKKENEGKFIVMNYDGNKDKDFVKADGVFASVPATQWFVKKANNGTHKFTIANRDQDVNLAKDAKIYVVDEEARIYTAGKDTFQVVEIEGLKEDAHLGYKYLTDAEQAIKSFVLTAKNYANPEAYFLSVGADSALVATPNADDALELVVATPTTKDTKLNDESILTRDYLLVSKDGKKTYYLKSEDGQLMITTKADSKNLKFRRVNDNADEYEVLYDGGKLSINQDGEGVKVAMNEATSYVFNLADAVNEQYMNFGNEGIKNVTISLDGDEASKVTAVKPFAVIKRTGLELKAAATDNDFVLGLDTAYINRPDNFRYAYYITKPIDTAKVGSFDMKGYMVSYADSIAHNSDTVKYDQDGLTRIGFVPANRVQFGNNDSLAIAKPKATAIDTINVEKANGMTLATWAFAIEEDGVYRIESSTGKYVSYLNGVLVLGNKDQAQLFNVNDTDLKPTDNEEIATSEVKVIAGNGNVTIAGAAGKKVVISNILGQTVANTVITSDNAVIAAPQGVVVVAVEGEEAVKAIIK